MTTSSEPANFAVPELKYDANGLIPAIVQDDATNEILMLGYMNEQSVRMTLEKRLVYVLEPQSAGVLDQGRDQRQRARTRRYPQGLRR